MDALYEPPVRPSARLKQAHPADWFTIYLTFVKSCAGADADRMFRLMRFAVMQGVFATVPSSRKEPQSASSLVFKNNRLSDTLRADHELSQKAMVGTALCCCSVLSLKGACTAMEAGCCWRSVYLSPDCLPRMHLMAQSHYLAWRSCIGNCILREKDPE